jgi:hypothetical protein
MSEYNEGGPIPGPVTIEQVIAHWNRYAVMETVPDALVTDSLRFSAHLDTIFGGMLLRLEKDLLTDTRAQHEYQASLRFPTSPWQHFKHKHRLAWWMRPLLRRRPVREQEYVVTLMVERWQTYPEARLPRETFGRAVVFERVTGPIWKDRPT